ncbi:asparaginase domain-containing protein [Cereibacter sp. SYSU M97828]|nr:asparaginase domain-containing protein [Cereibacter flavus]
MSPLVAVIATGGTIASSRGADGAKPSLRGEDLLAGLPALPVRLRPVELLAKDSSALTLADMQAIVDAVRAQISDPDIAGVVILHGTDAMEETSLLAHLQLPQEKPVIFTGAQFTADHPNADGPGNLADAIRAVLTGQPGVRIVFGGRHLPAWGAYKFSSDSADAFRGQGTAKLAGALPAPVSARVDIVAIHPGGDGLHLRASVRAGAKGVVLAALGSGNATADVVSAVREAGVPVVVSSRVPEGALAPAYGGGGGGHDLALAGAVHSRILRPGQARILLAALIANGAPVAEAFA